MRFTGVVAFTTLAATALASPIAQSYSEGSEAASPVEGADDESAQKIAPSGAGDLEDALPSADALPSGAALPSADALPSGAALPSADVTDPLPSASASGDLPFNKDDLEAAVPEEVNDVIAQEAAPSDSASPVSSCEEVIALLEKHVGSVKENTGSINSTLDKVDAGEISQEDANGDILSVLDELKSTLVEVVTALTGAAGIPVEAGQLDKVLGLLNTLLTELLAVVNQLVTTLDLNKELSGLLNIVFGLVAKILTLLITLLPGILSGLIGILTPLLSGLGQGLLGPILKPLVFVLGGLGGGLGGLGLDSIL